MKTRLLSSILAGAWVASTSCASPTPLTATGGQVRDASALSVERCQYLGEIYEKTEGCCFNDHPKIRARNAAAEKGATDVVWDIREPSRKDVPNIIAKAYRCADRP